MNEVEVRIDGFKLLAVYEDWTDVGSARWCYLVHPDGRGMVLCQRRYLPPAEATDRFAPQVFPDHADARKLFIRKVQQYIPERSSVA